MNNPDPILSESFTTFFNGWFSRQEELLKELLTFLPPDYGDDNSTPQKELVEGETERITELISRVGVHYFEYFKAKATLVQKDVPSVLLSSWLTPFERTFLWIGGFKPALVLRLVSVSASDRLRLTPDQKRLLGVLEEEVKADEAWLTGELTRLQRGAVLATEIVAVLFGESEDLTAMNTLQSSFQTLVECGDALRIKVSAKIQEILDPIQKVKFFVELGALQVGSRKIGLRAQERLMKIPN